jgi:hypothetical protein
MVDNSKAGIIQFVRDGAADRWERDQSPYLVSDIGNDLKAEGISYRDIIGEEINLVGFLRENAAGKFKVIAHPIQKAKVGVIPPDRDYSFDRRVEPTPDSSERRFERTRRQTPKKYVVLNFLEALAELDESEIEKIQIPLSVLAKLLVKK